MSSSSLSLIGVGDVQAPRAPADLFDNVAPILRAADITFGNCEWPHAEQAGDVHPVELHLEDQLDDDKPGGLFDPGEPASIALYGDSGFDVMSFCNNHCLHAGYRAFFRTMELMREAGMAPVDAGANIAEASRPVIVERNGTKVAFVA